MNGSQIRQVVYGSLAVAGAVGTYTFNLQHRGSALDFLRDNFATPASSSIAVDIIVLAIACGVLIVVESRRLGIRRPWLYLILAGVIAAAFAVPLWLAVRERALERRRSDAAAAEQ